MNTAERKPAPEVRRLAWALGLTAPLLAAGAVPPVGTADLRIRAEAGSVQVELSAAAQTLVGFTGTPGDATQKEDLKVAAENLKHGEALVRFNPQASCLLEEAKVNADPRQQHGEARMGANYRFNCVFPKSLKSAALGLFIGFPALQRVHVHYTTTQGQGAAVLTLDNPVVNFVPLQ